MSKHAKLSAQKREVIGNSVRIMRREGNTPAVVYSKTFQSLPVTINTRELMKVYKTAGKSQVIDLDIDGKVQPVIVKDIDSHPFKYIIRHVDFYAVDLKKEVESVVPVVLVGEAPAVKTTGALINQQVDELNVSALPDNIPSQIEVDISSLVEFTDVVSIADLNVGGKFKFVDPDDTTIVSLEAKAAIVEEEPVVTEETATEGEQEENSETAEEK